MRIPTKHPFLAYLCWSERDYRYAESPPINLLDRAALQHADPWIVLAAIVEHVKIGERAPVSSLRPLIRTEHPTSLLTLAALDLIGDAGSTRELEHLSSIMEDDPDVDLVVAACHAACCAGCLWLVRSMLAAWLRFEAVSNRQLITDYISQVLEEPTGPIGSLETDSRTEFLALVQSRIEDLNTQFGDDRKPLIEGVLFGVVSLRAAHVRFDSIGHQQPRTRSKILLLSA